MSYLSWTNMQNIYFLKYTQVSILVNKLYIKIVFVITSRNIFIFFSFSIWRQWKKIQSVINRCFCYLFSIIKGENLQTITRRKLGLRVLDYRRPNCNWFVYRAPLRSRTVVINFNRKNLRYFFSFSLTFYRSITLQRLLKIQFN